jgi:MFS family permease
VASFYVIGAVIGALGFGWLTDRFGRRFVFYVTLIVYLTGVLLSAFAWDFWSFAFFRMITGLGIGGEYAAVNSAIDELIPAKYRGRIDLIVNGSFWLGAAAGALASPFLLDQHLFPDQHWLAAGIRNRGDARTFDLNAAALRTGKSSMACYSLPQRRSGRHHQTDRAPCR